jgi:hypothetical protein
MLESLNGQMYSDTPSFACRPANNDLRASQRPATRSQSRMLSTGGAGTYSGHSDAFLSTLSIRVTNSSAYQYDASP